MKKFITEFKEFAVKGNVVDMAVGVVIGSAFSSIVTSLVNDLIMPLVAVMLGDVNFTNLKLVLKGEGENAITWNYGNFIQIIFNFLIISLCIFIVIRFINRFKKQKEEEETAPAEPKLSDETKALNEIIEILKNK